MKRCVLILLLGTIAGVAVLAYNFWSFCCGRCTLGHFLIIGPFEKSMIGVVLFAALCLVAIKVFRRRRLASNRCRCGEILFDNWAFCPECGASRR